MTQSEDKSDVLYSNRSIEGPHEATGDEVAAIRPAAAKYYQVIVMDSGNSKHAVNWRATIERSQQLVVPRTNVEDSAEAGTRML